MATVKRLCEANSVPRSHVRDAINPFGSVRTALASARTTWRAPTGGVFASQTNQEQEARVALDERGDV